MADDPSRRAAPPSYQTVLTIDETTAHVSAPAAQAEALLAWFAARGLRCRLREEEGGTARAVLDFGNPVPAQERRIRAAFAEWQRCPGTRGGPSWMLARNGLP